MMELVNELQAQEPLDTDISSGDSEARADGADPMVSPMTPHVAEELWEILGIAGRLIEDRNGRAIAKT